MSEPSELVLSASSLKTRRIPIEQRFARLRLKATRIGDCLVFPCKNNRPTISRGGGGNGSRLLTRVSWEIANGRSIPDGLWVLHHCDNPPCIEPRHLYLGDRAQNTRDMVERDRSGRRRHPESWTLKSHNRALAKLTWDQVDEIRVKHQTKMSCRSLAEEYGVHVATIQRIVNLSIWRPEAHP